MDTKGNLLDLVCKDVDKSYVNQAVLRKFNLETAARHLIISGRNGCGKTTFLRLIAGIEQIDKGSITWQGNDVMAVATKKKVGISANCIVLPEFLTVRQVVDFHCHQYGCLFPSELIEQIYLSPFLEQKIEALSLGTAKKVSLVLAFAHSPDLLLLDEPSNGLDEQAMLTLSQWCNDFKGCIILATHDQTFCKGLDAQLLDLSRCG